MRYERKYRLENSTPWEVEQVIRNHTASFFKSFPDRKVNNYYFDTADLATFHENLSGVGERNKYRVRWYGAITEGPVTAHLEIKHKRNELGYKTITTFNDLPIHDLERISFLVNKELEGVGGPLQPSIYNSYWRSYFESFDRKFRVTIDKDLLFRSPIALPGSEYRDEAVVVEAKYDAHLDTQWMTMAQALPFRLSKNSKYVTGVYYAFA